MVDDYRTCLIQICPMTLKLAKIGFRVIFFALTDKAIRLFISDFLAKINTIMRGVFI